MRTSAIALLAAALGGCGQGAPQASAGATPGPTPPAAVVSATPTSPAVEPSPTRSPRPRPTFGGEFPEPGATIPPGQPVLAGLTIDALAGVWSELGMSCESVYGPGPEAAADYGVHCEAPNPGGPGVEVVAGAAYWTTSGVAEIEVVVSPGMEGTIDAAAFANAWVVPFAELVGGPDAVAFVLDHVDDPTCGGGCTMAIEGSDLSYYTGHRGAQELFYVPRFT